MLLIWKKKYVSCLANFFLLNPPYKSLPFTKADSCLNSQSSGEVLLCLSDPQICLFSDLIWQLHLICRLRYSKHQLSCTNIFTTQYLQIVRHKWWFFFSFSILWIELGASSLQGQNSAPERGLQLKISSFHNDLIFTYFDSPLNTFRERFSLFFMRT